MIVLVLALPYVFFVSTILPRGRYGLFLFAGSMLSKLFSPFITIYIFLYAMYYFNDLNWGKTHGSQPTPGGQGNETVAGPAKEKDPDLERCSGSPLTENGTPKEIVVQQDRVLSRNGETNGTMCSTQIQLVEIEHQADESFSEDDVAVEHQINLPLLLDKAIV